MSNRMKPLYLLLLVPALLVLAAGCGEREAAREPEEEPGEPETAKEEPMEEPSEDVRHALQLWDEMQGYTNWPQPERFQGWQPGKSPHGAVLKYYVNGTAVENATADGAIIVKENYSAESDDALMSVTVMEKRAGYDPETKNWFYVKYSPDGEVMENPAGKPLAGTVGKGGAKGCVPCHANAGGDDYLFMND